MCTEWRQGNYRQVIELDMKKPWRELISLEDLLIGDSGRELLIALAGYGPISVLLAAWKRPCASVGG